MAARASSLARRSPLPPGFNPLRTIELAAGFRDSVPDIMEFAISDRYLNRPYIYPRQATLLKTIFLQDELFCADERTEILTRRGWMTYDQVQVGEDVLTLNHETGLAEWAPADAVNIFPVQDVPLVSMEGYGHSSLTTLTHRWPVERYMQQRGGGGEWRKGFATSATLRSSDRIACAAEVSNLPEATVSDDLVELVAWYWTEGHLRSSGGVTIGQSERANPAYVERIRLLLKRLYGEPVATLRGARAMGAWREDYGTPGMVYFHLNRRASTALREIAPGRDKVVSPDFLTSLSREQVARFIETSIDADGWREVLPSGKTKRAITQKVKARLDAMQMACSLAGIRTVLTERATRGAGRYAGRPHWHLSLYDTQRHFTAQARGRNFEVAEVQYTGVVWCPTTRNQTWLARRDGKVYFTGNTQYDYDVIGEWTESYIRTADEHGVGNNGMVPDVLERIRMLKAEGRPWFRETLNVSGRRGSKGHVGGYAGAYVLWNYMAWGDPQGHFGVDRDKKMVALVFAGKKEQARANQWKDLTNIILGGPCFAPYVSRALGEIVTVYAPHDFERMFDRWERGIFSEQDMATFEIIPKESTVMAARGPASFMQFYDEMAHVVATGANRSAEEVYECLHPDTRILHSDDLTWRRIGDVKVGDTLISYDEHPTEGGQRKMREATVLDVRRSRSVPLRLTFNDGSSVVCSDNHRWFRVSLDSRGQVHSGKWVTAGKVARQGSAGSMTRLRVGDHIRWIADPWGTDDSRTGGYVAGMFDGEGWLGTSAAASGYSVAMCQKPGAVFDATVQGLRDLGFDPKIVRHNGSSTDVWRAEVNGLGEVLRLLGQVRPGRLLPRHREVWEGKAPRGKVKHKTIVSIERLGEEQELVDITTSTGTFLAEGLVSHNSATPSLDQFKDWAFIYEPSSPWQKTGQFYTNYLHSIEKDEDTGEPVYPEMLMVQLASWDIYKDWEIANDLRTEPGGLRLMPLKGAIQEYDDQMRRLERANPETFRVERRCLDPETRVLCADLQWRAIKDLSPGDEVVAVDEHPPGVGFTQRKMRTAVIEAIETNVQPAYRIDFEDGSHVICSASHRWLSGGPGGGFRWRSLYAEPGAPGPRQSLRVGDRIRYVADPWEKDDSWGAGYLAGVYDGEGTVLCREGSEFSLSFVQNDNEVLSTTLRLLRERGFDPVHRPNAGRDAQVYLVRGFDEVARFVGSIGGSKVERQAIPHLWEGRGIPRPRIRGQVAKTITAITPLPDQPLVDIQTSTGTFIAEGLVSHNSHFATVMDAYLNEEKVKAMWEPYLGQTLVNQVKGQLGITYRAHGDPSKSGAGFGYAIGHIDRYDENGLPHVVFDKIHSWQPGDFEDNEIDYQAIEEDIKADLDAFMPGELTFDQFNSVSTIQNLRRYVAKTPRAKQTTIYERTATGPLNWKTYETFKTALNMGLVHGPYHELADLELRFLQDRGGKVEHPTSGPVQTKDIADCIAIVVYELIGEQMSQFLGKALGELPLAASVPGGMDPHAAQRAAEVAEQLSGFGRARGSMAARRGRR